MPQCAGIVILRLSEGSVSKRIVKKKGEMFRFQLNLPTGRTYERAQGKISWSSNGAEPLTF